MSDAYAPSESFHPRPALNTVAGWVLYGLAVFFALVAVTGLFYDLLKIVTGDTGAAQLALVLLLQPLRIGVLALWGTVCLGGARDLLWPEQYGREVQARAFLREIYDAHGLGSVRDLEAGGDFADLPSHDLTDVYRNLDRDAYPDRFRDLLGAVKERVEEATRLT